MTLGVPDLVRARLELARALFEEGNDVAAEFQFRLDQGGQFDDMQVEAYLGPEMVRDWGEFSVLGLVLKRWYGNAPYYNGYGGRAEAGWNVTSRYRLDAYVQVAALWYPEEDFLNGYQVDAALAHTYALSSSSYVRGIFGLGHRSECPSTRRSTAIISLTKGSSSVRTATTG